MRLDKEPVRFGAMGMRTRRSSRSGNKKEKEIEEDQESVYKQERARRIRGEVGIKSNPPVRPRPDHMQKFERVT
jgi:hypothetical protein